MPVSLLDDYPLGSARDGSCYVCNASRRTVRDGREVRSEKVVDLHVHIDFEGHLMLCESCAAEIGRIVGLVDPGDAVRLAVELDSVRAELAVVVAERDAAAGLVAGLRNWDASHPVEPPAVVDPPKSARTRRAHTKEMSE